MNQDEEQPVETLWPDEKFSDGRNLVRAGEPDLELALILLAAGQTQAFVRHKCGFESRRAVEAFCRDEETRAAVKELAGERVARLGRLATVGLERILTTPQSDLRAEVLAIRTALEVSGELKKDAAQPVKSVRELSVGELSELIEATRRELDNRISRQRADRRISTATT